ncbi:molybdopterin guanine dinucleotide-containing S/N-oxide reductase [Bosea sp. BH3]|uniref:molybdopterin guanine dinucleotide-containing S/N-oxide reductase n=1 Tax=Bosea sp. BH3 TaxID=2871701 RepID=UPI0021CB34AB|nr:molybdopterin guanine dinucleotide-containing S/N-oxide reductase [Bosea sp. BH3]MCU4181841.1 molybdopterin guanine dinucleotide-containing S/N-oxide reductase [Bosea sp. BH3]
MLPPPDSPTISTHWGTYRARFADGALAELQPYELDPDPSPIVASMIEGRTAPARIMRPAVRRSFLERGAAAGGQGRGIEPFVEVEWDVALDLAARELARVSAGHGNKAIFGGSYGWSSAGRFHHAQSQIHRFLNSIGGYTRSVQNYSFAAAEIIVKHVLGSLQGLATHHTPWELIVGHAELIVMFGGTPHRNAQVGSGGISRHRLREEMAACRRAGAEFVSVSPIRDDALAECDAQWLAPRPGSDTALMLAIAHVLITEGLHDEAALARLTIGFDRLRAYVLGEVDGTPKDPDWASGLTGVEPDVISALARRMAAKKTFIMMSWSLQRADHGEQPFWMAIALAAMLGGIGLPGRGFGFGYGCANGVGSAMYPFSWPSLPSGTNAVSDYIPVARIADMLLAPGAPYDFNGEKRRYPDIRLIYWCGGNPFHHHQDLNRLVTAWRQPEVVIVNESFWNGLARHADIVFPATTQMERNDIACSARDLQIAASHKLAEPAGEARDDFGILSGLAERLGVAEAFTEGRDVEAWLRHFYTIARQRVAEQGLELPDFEAFWRAGITVLPPPTDLSPLLGAFRADPVANPLPTPSGRIELFSETIARFGYDDCPGHPVWREPHEWLGSTLTARFPLHVISSQPATKLHSQYDHGSHSRASKIKEREPVRMHPEDAGKRGLSAGDIVRVFNDRGSCLAGVVLSDALLPGVVQLSTGAWYDPLDPARSNSLDKHGNPNVLTDDRGTSRLAQGPSAHSCLVEIELFHEPLPALTAFLPPALETQNR